MSSEPGSEHPGLPPEAAGWDLPPEAWVLPRVPESRRALRADVAARLGMARTEELEGVLGELARHLESPSPVARIQALDALEALAFAPDPDRIPKGALDYLLDHLGRSLRQEPLAGLKPMILERALLLAGTLGARGEREGLLDRIAWLREEAEGAAPASIQGLLASPCLLLPALEAFKRRGEPFLVQRLDPLLALLGPAGARALIRLLREEPYPLVRAQLLGILARVGPEALPSLHAALGKGPWYLTRNLLEVLARKSSPDSFPWVASFVADPDPRVARAARKALWRTGGRNRGTALARLLRGGRFGTLLRILGPGQGA